MIYHELLVILPGGRTTGGLRERFATEVNPKVLARVSSLARNERRRLPALVEQALADLLQMRKQGRLRANVMAIYQGRQEHDGGRQECASRGSLRLHGFGRGPGFAPMCSNGPPTFRSEGPEVPGQQPGLNLPREASATLIVPRLQ
jgi:predicted transcriptional regulator